MIVLQELHINSYAQALMGKKNQAKFIQKCAHTTQNDVYICKEQMHNQVFKKICT
jgi:hypothetical protein